MSKLDKIDTILSKQMQLLEKEVINLKFKVACTFELGKNVEDVKLNNLAYSGIYLFEIKTDPEKYKYTEWKNKFIKKWRDKKYHGKHTPNLKEKRLSQHTKLKTWMPLYLGKSKNISKRIESHLFLGLEKTTFALKLAERKNLKNSTIRIRTINIGVNNYDLIIPKIESQLREKLNPLAGKQ